MGIKQNEDGTWTAFYSKRHPITRKPKSLRRTKLQSKAKAKRVENELITRIHDEFKKTKVPTWDKCVEEFIKDYSNRDYSQKTIESYYLCLKAHTYAEWKNQFIDTITPNDIRELIREKVGDKSQSHQKNLLKYIKGCFNYALEKRYILSNPTPRMKFKIGQKLKEVLTEEQARTLLKQAKEMDCEWHPIWATALYTGMRNGELYALTWDKVNLDKRRIKIDCSWNNKDGFKDTKSGDDRIAEIAPPLYEIFKELKTQNLNPPFVLPRLHAWDKGEQARELRFFLQGLGLPRIRFHDLRASWATIMLSKGIPPIKVMAMGGWKDLKTMQRYIRKAGINIDGITDSLKF